MVSLIGMDTNNTKRQYHIIYCRISDQELFKDRLVCNLSDTDSVVTIPRMEYYRRSEKTVKIKPVFPGYIFIKTSLTPFELHDVIKRTKLETSVGVRELDFRERLDTMSDYRDMADNDLDAFIDIDDAYPQLEYQPYVSIEEEEFLDFLCDGKGLLEMSQGYQDNKRYVVMEGPLKAFSDKIYYVDKHNRKAFLDFEIDRRHAVAGFECKPKAHWYPVESSKITYLYDGTEVDLDELEKSLTSLRD